MKQFSCPDCKVKLDTCEGCQRYCVKEQKQNNIFPTHPFNLPNTYIYTPPSTYEYECCKGCSNNPVNGGSGICNCTLPYFERSITYNTINTTTTTSQTFLYNNITDNIDNGENI